MTQLQNANEIINQAAVEVGLTPVEDPFASPDAQFIQLRFLLNTAGRRLVYHYQWEHLQREHIFTIDDQLVEQDYDLPDDFAYMIDQTGWMRDQNVPLAGPLSPQDWQYLLGRNLVSSTIYASFRLQNRKLRIFAQGQLKDEEIAYEYISDRWVESTVTPGQRQTEVQTGSDIVNYEPTLVALYLKARWLGSKGFDTTKADDEFSDAFLTWAGVNKSAPKLNAAKNYLGYPYLDAWRNLPDSGYGNKPIIG